MTTELFTQGTINTNNLNSDYSHNTVHKALEERQIFKNLCFTLLNIMKGL